MNVLLDTTFTSKYVVVDDHPDPNEGQDAFVTFRQQWGRREEPTSLFSLDYDQTRELWLALGRKLLGIA